MQKDFPKCQCGQVVWAEEIMVPVYDDGGSVDAFSPEIIYGDQCEDCYIKHSQPCGIDGDELPF